MLQRNSKVDVTLWQPGQEAFPGYRLVQKLGQGDAGEVWEAKRPDNSLVALKFITFSDLKDAAAEIKTLENICRIHHANLIEILGVWSVPGGLLLSMDRADGSLQDLVDLSMQEYGTGLEGELVIQYLRQVAEVLDFLNSPVHRLVDGRIVGFQHCNIKPSNLLLFGDTVKISDLGLASSFSIPSHRKLTNLDYAAPEVYQGKFSNHIDQYALALTYATLRLGKLPFPSTGNNLRGSWPRRRPKADLSALSEEEQNVLNRALAMAPGERWKSCKELIMQLDFALSR
ncbi:MAG: hypothetical protein KatS3mg105_2255 [Gemmatales bacterium]|nr:MAG: hypothetical protein KatS3mg105_2255 [Gemmatales bacterium]